MRMEASMMSSLIDVRRNKEAIINACNMIYEESSDCIGYGVFANSVSGSRCRVSQTLILPSNVGVMLETYLIATDSIGIERFDLELIRTWSGIVEFNDHEVAFIEPLLTELIFEADSAELPFILTHKMRDPISMECSLWCQSNCVGKFQRKLDSLPQYATSTVSEFIKRVRTMHKASTPERIGTP
jgi:hypothetical protein